MDRHILLNPGPVNLSNRVRQAMLKPDLCHRETEFADLQNRVRENLLDVYELSDEVYGTILLTGSGTSAVEAMLISMIPENGHVLVIENGVYGERMSRILDVYGIKHMRLHHEWLETINLDELDAALKQNNISHVAVVHHETTTGRLNNIEGIVELCVDRDVSLLVDGVSSFGAEKTMFDRWNIAACAGTANKCLHGVPGISFVIARRDKLNTNGQGRSLYLDLKNYLKHQDTNGTPFTQSVQCLYALDEALNEFNEQGGQRSRQQQYKKRMQIVREGLIAMDIDPLIDEQDCSCVLNAFHLPKDATYEQLHDLLKENGFIIYAGQGDLAKTIFRVSTMGAITEDVMKRFVSVMKKIISK